MATYIRTFKKTVWGFASVEAKNIKQAQKLFDEGMFDEFDNKSHYEISKKIEQQGGD